MDLIDLVERILDKDKSMNVNSYGEAIQTWVISQQTYDELKSNGDSWEVTLQVTLE